MYSIDSFITTLQSKHPYQQTVRKLNVDIIESALSFWKKV